MTHSPKTPLKRELFLIIFGSIISAVSITGTNILNHKLEAKNSLERSKLEFTKDLSEITGKRLFISFSLYRANRDNTGESEDWQYKYFESIEEWNSKSAYYLGLIELYYGENNRVEFEKNIYRPILEFGIKANSKAFTKEEQAEMNDLYSRINSNSIALMSTLLRE